MMGNREENASFFGLITSSRVQETKVTIAVPNRTRLIAYPAGGAGYGSTASLYWQPLHGRYAIKRARFGLGGGEWRRIALYLKQYNQGCREPLSSLHDFMPVTFVSCAPLFSCLVVEQLIDVLVSRLMEHTL